MKPENKATSSANSATMAAAIKFAITLIATSRQSPPTSSNSSATSKALLGHVARVVAGPVVGDRVLPPLRGAASGQLGHRRLRPAAAVPLGSHLRILGVP